jgi:putative DNA primase/helicase
VSVAVAAAAPRFEMVGIATCAWCLARRGVDEDGYCELHDSQAKRDRDAKRRKIMEGSARGEAHPQTDIANGRRFVEQHGDNVRYNADSKRWLAWDGIRWHDNAVVEIESRAKDTAVSIWDEAKESKNTNLSAWAVRSESAAGVHGMLEMAHSEASVAITTAVLDTDPWLLNTPSGTVNLKTGELRPARREDLITKVTAAPFDPDAECPRWLQFHDEIFIHADFTTDQELIDYMQRLAGYSLTGSVREQMFAVLHGTGRNGKSVWMNVIRGLLGDYAGTTGSDLLLSKRTDAHPVGLAALSGYRLIHATETDASRRLDEATVKNITGGDPITARWMHGNPFTFEPQFKLMLATNHKPDIKGTDEGIWRRIDPIPFLRTIDPAKVDDKLGSKLEEEWPGILAWMVRGCLDWQDGGLRAPLAVTEARREYRQESDAVRRFTEDRCECLHGAQVEIGQLFAAYRDWCEGEGEQHLSSTAFGRELSNRGYPGDTATISLKTRRIRRHIRLVSEAD